MCSDLLVFFFFSSRRRHTRWTGDWSSDVCSSDLAEQVFASVDGTGAERWPHVFGNEFVAQVFDVALGGAGGDGLLPDAGELLALSDVGGDADDARTVVFAQPRDDDRGVESTRIGEGDRTNHDGSGGRDKYALTVHI